MVREPDRRAARDPPGRPPVRILDLACGGSRYARDSIPDQDTGRGVELTLLDQDPAALAFDEEWLPRERAPRDPPDPDLPRRARTHGRARTRTRGEFDLVISTGLFDYLDDPAAGRLLAEMGGLARRGGSVAVCNFARPDASRIVKDWMVEWTLIYRDCSALRELVPEGHAVGLTAPPTADSCTP